VRQGPAKQPVLSVSDFWHALRLIVLAENIRQRSVRKIRFGRTDAKEHAMRRITLMLAGLAVAAAIGAPTAMAGGHHGHHGGHGPVSYGYRGGNYGYYGYRGPYAGGYRGCYGPGPAFGYAAPVYPYAYAAPGFGVSTPNFSFWLGQ
jgi:hypothetical protein